MIRDKVSFGLFMPLVVVPAFVLRVIDCFCAKIKN